MTVIDVAGGATGGAARFRREIAAWAADNPRRGVRLIGVDQRATPSWLLRREGIALRSKRIAANNVGFLTGIHPRVTMLRNALHFLLPGEEQIVAGLPRGFGTQITVVRQVAARADVLVVPSTAMAERVAHILPRLVSRIRVRHQPLTSKPKQSLTARDRYVLFPSLPAVHKDALGTLGMLVQAIEATKSHVTVKITWGPAACGRWASHPLVESIGPQSLDQIDTLRNGAVALFAPYQVESFGYVVAEGRACGIPTLGIDSPQNREIGASALFGYKPDDLDSLAAALRTALASRVTPDPTPFDRDAYCEWLTTVV